jgi:hypothetical protein
MLRPVFAEDLVTSLPEDRVNTFDPVVYPNPSTGTFAVKGNVRQMTIYDLQGRLISQKTFERGELTENLSLQGCADGIYLLHLVNEQHTKIIKLVLQRQ